VDFDALFTLLFGSHREPLELQTLAGDASSRRYHRAVFGPGADPGRVVIMELPADALASDEATAGGPPPELSFLNVGRHLAARGIRVPRVYLDAVSRGAVVLEDLGDATLARRIAGVPRGELRLWYLAAVELLARLHEAMWPVPAGCLAESRSFDFALLRWELDHYREWGAEALRGETLAAPVRAALDTEFDALARAVEALPRGFVHRDYQSRNLMVIGDEPAPASLALIDFQDALTGPRVYDLVALLNDSYVELDEELKQEIIVRYAFRRGIDAAALRAEFDLVTVQRKLKDGGRFVFIDRVRRNPAFLPYVDTSFGRVRRALERLPGREGLRAALAAAAPTHFG
jgi:aminoglycoside/choline kinase family phosphotransferase